MLRGDDTTINKIYREEAEDYLIFLVLLERSHESGLLGVGLEPSVTKLGGGVDELEVDLLQSSLLGVGQQRLTEGQQPLLGSNAATLP